MTLANAKIYNLDQKIKNIQITKTNELSKYLVSTSTRTCKKPVPLTGNNLQKF